MKRQIILMLPALISMSMAACGTAGDANTDPQSDGGQQGDSAGMVCPPTNAQPVSAAPVALIVTNNALKGSFEALAALHTLAGTVTKVVTIDSICAAATCQDNNPKQDTAKAIKDYLMAQSGLKYAILGGDSEIVPSRMVHDLFTSPLPGGDDFDEDFATDYYYSDFSEWDANGDGVYAEDGTDSPSYLPSIAVSRISVKVKSEADAYNAKVMHHLTNYESNRAPTGLLLSNVAAEFDFGSNTITIDSAMYFEQAGRTASLMPTGFQVDKLYATGYGGAPQNSSSAELLALDKGYNLVIHAGHGDVDELTVEYTGDEAVDSSDVLALRNTTASIFLSCACLAGDFTDPDEDCAGESFVKNPSGGGILYLGNITYGLGLAGGSQLIDEVLRYIQSSSDGSLFADAYLAGHKNMPKTDSFQMVISIPVVTQGSYEWTQKSVVLLGDELIPVWLTARPQAPTFTVDKQTGCGSGSHLTFTFASAVSGAVRFSAGEAVYQLALNGQQTASIDIAENPSQIVAVFASPTTLYGYQQTTF